MPTAHLTAEQKLEAVQAVEKHGSITAAAEALGLPRTTLGHRYRMGVKAGLDDAIVHPVPSGHALKGVSTLYDGAGQVTAQWVKTRADQPSIDEIIESIQGAFDTYAGSAGLGIRAEGEEALSEENCVTIYPLPDWHVGLLSWRKETGEDWDLPIAKQRITEAMTALVARSPRSKHAVVLGLGDLLHSDGYDNMTPKSKHLLDVDGRWPKVLKLSTELIIHTIELALARHDTVLVRILPGNHDLESAIAVAYGLSLYYKGHDRVAIDDSPGYFWWWVWGKNLLGATHGDRAKMKDLPILMATKNAEAWGQSKFRHIFTGHIHMQTGIEVSGVLVESFRTPVAPDSYHSGMGYSSGRTVTSITYHKEDGEISRSRAPVLIGEAA